MNECRLHGGVMNDTSLGSHSSICPSCPPLSLPPFPIFFPPSSSTYLAPCSLCCHSFSSLLSLFTPPLLSSPFIFCRYFLPSLLPSFLSFLLGSASSLPPSFFHLLPSFLVTFHSSISLLLSTSLSPPSVSLLSFSFPFPSVCLFSSTCLYVLFFPIHLLHSFLSSFPPFLSLFHCFLGPYLPSLLP